MDPMWYSLQYYCNLSCGGGSVMVAMRLFQSPQNSFLTPLYYLLAVGTNFSVRSVAIRKGVMVIHQKRVDLN